MTRSLTRTQRVVALVCAFAVSTVVPSTVWAADRESPTGATSLRTSVQQAAVVESHRLEKTRQRVLQSADSQSQTQSSGREELERASFFKRPVGIAVLAAFGVGVGYALYSSQNDRIRSEGR